MTKQVYNFLCILNLGFRKNSKFIIIHKYNLLILRLIKKLFQLKIISMYQINDSTKKVCLFLNNTLWVNSYQCVTVSKPGKRVYFSLRNLKKNKLNFRSYVGRIFIISTKGGVYTLSECIKYNIGGELLCIL